MLDEDEEGVLHLPRRERDVADDLLQRKRATAQEAVEHLLREVDWALGQGIRAARARVEHAKGMPGRGPQELTDTRGPKWSEMMLTARRMPCCDTMVAWRWRGRRRAAGQG
jgi:hypothetical protein